jgi:hypothetical protein
LLSGWIPIQPKKPSYEPSSIWRLCQSGVDVANHRRAHDKGNPTAIQNRSITMRQALCVAAAPL